MGEATSIQWCHHTFNSWRGCTKVSPGCTNCYAETMSKRNPGVLGVWGDAGTRVVAAESYWRQPLKWDRDAAKAGERRRVFAHSLSDVFEDREDLHAPRARLFRLIEATPNLDWLLLTKRPRIAREFDGWFGLTPNVWLGVSVENQQAADERIPVLLSVPAKVRFLSMEPLLGPVDLGHHLIRPEVPCPDGLLGCEVLHLGPSLIHWVIVGGESGGKARPFNVGWAESIRDQCKAAGVAFFMKQEGSNPYCDTYDANTGLAAGTMSWKRRDSHGGDWSEWQLDLRVREVPTP